MNRQWSLPARYFTLAVLLVLFGLLVWQVRQMLPPLIGALLIAYLLYPFVELLHQRLHLNRRLAANLVYFVTLAVIVAVPASLLPVLDRELRMVANDLLVTLNSLEITFSRPIQVGMFTINLSRLIPGLLEQAAGLTAPVVSDPLALLESTSRGTLWTLVVLVGGYYFLTDWDRVREWLIRQAPPAYRPDARRLYLEMKKIWLAYLRSQLTLMFIIGVAFSITWAAIGLPGALILGILAGVFTIIPDIGPFIGALLAVIVALLEGSNWPWLQLSNFWYAVLVAGLAGLYIGIKNIWLRPLVFGRSVHLNEGLVFVAIVAAVIFTGILGAFIVVPTLASVVVLVRYLKQRILGLPPFPRHAPELVRSHAPRREAGRSAAARSSERKA